MDDYEPLFTTKKGTDNIESVFRTQRPNQPEGVGSTYAHFSDATTIRNRSGAGHKDKTTGIQSPSGRTIFMNPKDIDRVAGIFQNPELSTSFMPVMENGKPTGQVALMHDEDYGPKKAGTVIHQAPYETKPKVGLAPVEIWDSRSPVGSTGNIHFGNKISEVHPRPARLTNTLPIGGNSGYRPGVDSLQHSLNPLKLAKGGMIVKPLDGGQKTI
jgi:hypothetical protein